MQNFIYNYEREMKVIEYNFVKGFSRPLNGYLLGSVWQFSSNVLYLEN